MFSLAPGAADTLAIHRQAQKDQWHMIITQRLVSDRIARR